MSVLTNLQDVLSSLEQSLKLSTKIFISTLWRPESATAGVGIWVDQYPEMRKYRSIHFANMIQQDPKAKKHIEVLLGCLGVVTALESCLSNPHLKGSPLILQTDCPSANQLLQRFPLHMPPIDPEWWHQHLPLLQHYTHLSKHFPTFQWINIPPLDASSRREQYLFSPTSAYESGWVEANRFALAASHPLLHEQEQKHQG